MTPLYPGVKRKPALDETGFQQLLAAAFVLQQHNDSLRAKDPRLDTSWILSRVAETQSLLGAGGLELATAARLIADRLRTMTGAAGVSISLTSDGYLDCTAESGIGTKVPGSSLASHSLVATERLRNGRVFQSADAQKDARLDTARCRELGVRALLAVPVQRFGEVAGLVEVRWSKPDAFHECDVRTSQLMAALATEILERQADSQVNQIAVPQTPPGPPFSLPWPGVPGVDEGVTEVREVEDLNVTPADSPALATPASDCEPPAEILAGQCRVCGRSFEANDAFCGNCSMPRAAVAPSEDLQSKWASLWYMQQAQDALQERESPPVSRSGRSEQQKRGNFARQETEKESEPESVWRRPETTADSVSPEPESRDTLFLSQYATGTRPRGDPTRDRLKRMFHTVRLRMRRRDAILAMSSFALLLILAVWSWLPAPTSHLTWFESVLVQLGLAEVPPRAPAVHTGNADVRVWVDVHTALYYCPGSDLYGKTPGGQFATQHDAQQDQFEPATGAVCE